MLIKESLRKVKRKTVKRSKAINFIRLREKMAGLEVIPEGISFVFQFNNHL